MASTSYLDPRQNASGRHTEVQVSYELGCGCLVRSLQLLLGQIISLQYGRQRPEVHQWPRLLGLEHSQDGVAGQDGPAVADLNGQFHCWDAGREVRDHGWANHHWDHTHIQAAVEGHNELYSGRVQESNVIT